MTSEQTITNLSVTFMLQFFYGSPKQWVHKSGLLMCSLGFQHSDASCDSLSPRGLNRLCQEQHHLYHSSFMGKQS